MTSRCRACNTLFTEEEEVVADEFCRRCLVATFGTESPTDYDGVQDGYDE